MHREPLLKLLAEYTTPFMDEAAMVERTRRFILQHANCFDRRLPGGHVTGSSWVVNPSRTHVLMLHHRKLDMWLQPGGHADNEPDMQTVVLKETAEETGLEPTQIRLFGDRIFDVDIHVIYPSEHDPRHVHYDIRFLAEIDDRIPIHGNDESFDIRWVPLQQVLSFNHARSFYRMVQKTRRLAQHPELYR